MTLPRSWVASAAPGSDFPLQNLPFGVVAGAGDQPHGVVRIGDEVVDLRGLVASGLLDEPAQSAADAAAGGALNDLFALGAEPRIALRAALQSLLVEGSPRQRAVAEFLTPVSEVAVLLPARIGDYTDFYVGIHHARNIGALFRPDDPLLPNYKWMPIAYHGRASSVRVSGTPIMRPHGQLKLAETPTFAPTRRLDFELELGVWIGPGIGSVSRYPLHRPNPTLPATACSTTGPRATCKPGSTNRWDRFSRRTSVPRSHRG